MGTGVRKPTGRPGPAGCGRAERPQKYSSLHKEGSGTRTVVQGKGEGVGGGAVRDGHQEKFNEGQEFRQKPSGLNIEGRNQEISRNAETPKKTFARRRLSTRQERKDNRGGRRLLRPSTPTQAKYHQPHRSKTHRHSGAGIQERALVGVHRRSPPEESTGQTTGYQTLLEGRPTE